MALLQPSLAAIAGYFEDGGGGGNRTRVRKHSAFGSTCLSRYLI